MYLAFSFAKHKYLLYLHELSNVKKFQPLTREAFKLVLDKVKQQCEGIANSLYQIAWTTFPKTPSYDDTKHGLSTILCEKSSSCRWRASPIIICVEGYLLCPLHDGWVWENGPYLVFSSCLGFTCIFLEDDHGT
jgi:hypothetical protein